MIWIPDRRIERTDSAVRSTDRDRVVFLEPSKGRAVRWIYITILILLVACGAILRFSQIGRPSLWLDEYWTQYLASGRGSGVFELPGGVIFDPPPQVGFDGALHWWHIWTGMSSASHPPLYPILLRWWIDVFTDSDVADRGLSACLSLCAVVIFFIVLRFDRGPWPALAGAGVLAFAPAQIELSQQIRPYTLLVLLGLLCCWAVLAIQRRGASWPRTAALCLATLAMLLTHYFAPAPLIGLFLFALIFMRGRNRAAVLGALTVGALLAIAAWGPMFLRSLHSQLIPYADLAKSSGGSVLGAAWTAPARLTVMVDNHLAWSAACGIALLVLAAPLLRGGKPAEIWLWWLWTICAIGFLALIDLQRHGNLLAYTRYIFVASPGVYALATMPLGWNRLIRSICPAVILLCVGIAGLDQYGLGPPPRPDWKQLSRELQRQAAPDDLIIFVGRTAAHRQTRFGEIDPRFNYIVFRHYAPAARQPVMFVTDSLPASALAALAKRPRIWVVGLDPQGQTEAFFPGWHYVMSPSPPGACIWKIFP